MSAKKAIAKLSELCNQQPDPPTPENVNKLKDLLKEYGKELPKSITDQLCIQLILKDIVQHGLVETIMEVAKYCTDSPEECTLCFFIDLFDMFCTPKTRNAIAFKSGVSKVTGNAYLNWGDVIRDLISHYLPEPKTEKLRYKLYASPVFGNTFSSTYALAVNADIRR